MKIVIIEDEPRTAKFLAETILKVDDNIHIIAILTSIEDSVEWFQNNKNPDLIFSDIQLGDGLSFEIFKTISNKIPVIFCTAFDEYALSAFKANGIDYILKPFTLKIIEEAITKYRNLKGDYSNSTIHYDKMLELFENKTTQKTTSLLVNCTDGIIPINLNDIALFYLENEITYLITLDQKKHTINKSLEVLEKLAVDQFYRVNRQYLINRKIVKKVQKYSENQFSILLNIDEIESVQIRRIKYSDFLNWLTIK